jgi:hypothetical protein
MTMAIACLCCTLIRIDGPRRSLRDGPTFMAWLMAGGLVSARPLRAREALHPLPRDHRYDVAFSFAGADREVARELADVAKANGLHVFFDEFHLWESWGKDLSEYLDSVYNGSARYCVILISEDYCRQPYTIHERRIALARALRSADEYVLPVVLDDSWPAGLPRTTAYLDLRVMSLAEIAAIMVRKITGKDRPVRAVGRDAGPQIALVDSDQLSPTRPPAAAGCLIDFADVGIAPECIGWIEKDPFVVDTWSGEPARWTFRGDMSYDPILDITIINRSGEPRLISRVGIVALGMSFKAYGEFGGGGAEPIVLHRIYEIAVPDLWQLMAGAHRAQRDSPGGYDAGRWPWVTACERASCRLPDPVLMNSDSAYRFGLRLFDYTNFCPTEVELVFSVRTDRGECQSERSRLSYLITKGIPPLSRLDRMVKGEPAIAAHAASAAKYAYLWNAGEQHERVQRMARSLWERAGRPAGRDQGFWAAAEQELGRELLAEEVLSAAHKRPL